MVNVEPLQVDSIKDMVQLALSAFASSGTDGIAEEQLKDFKKRKLINNV